VSLPFFKCVKPKSGQPFAQHRRVRPRFLVLSSHEQTKPVFSRFYSTKIYKSQQALSNTVNTVTTCVYRNGIAKRKKLKIGDFSLMSPARFYTTTPALNRLHSTKGLLAIEQAGSGTGRKKLPFKPKLDTIAERN